MNKLLEIVKSPYIVVSVFTSNPPLGDIDALTLPLTILFNSNPVTPLAGILYKPVPSPLNEPVKIEPLTSPVNDIEPVLNVFVETNS